ncbi:MAG: methyltransferase domain-containing protein [Pseudomonadota bacterium]
MIQILAQKFDKRLDVAALERKVKAMYRDVAVEPHGEFHFEIGRALAERLGYAPADLDAIPGESIDSFAGVGYYFDLADLQPGETVVDLGSGSGMDSFIAALEVGAHGTVTGVDMTDEQLAKSERLRAAGGFGNVAYRKGCIQGTGLPAESGDAVISNGVINWRPTRARCSAKQRACCAVAAAWRWRTSPRRSRCPKASPATPRSGPRASAVPCSSTTTSRRSSPPACACAG